MLPTSGRWSKAMSPLRPRVSGCRASWSRQCRCPQRTGMHRAAPAEAESTRSQGPRTRSLNGAAFVHFRAWFRTCPQSHRRERAGSNSNEWTQLDWSSTGLQNRRVGVRVPPSMRIVEGPTGTGPATWSRGQGAVWHRANGHMAVERLSRPRPQRWGVGANSRVDSIRQEAGPANPSGEAGAATCRRATHGGDVGEPALRHMRRLGNWLARLAVDQVPSWACRFESCPAYFSSGGTSRWPATAAVSKTEGPHGRASSILAPSAMEGDAGVAWRPVATRVVARGHEVRLLHLPPGSVGPVGVDARLSSGRSRVQVPYGARSSPHEVVAACRILSPVARVQVPVGVRTKLSWRNWQTPRIQVPVSIGRVGSTPTESTDAHPPAGTGRRAALRARCPSGREGSTPSVGTSGRGQVSRLALHAGPSGFDTPSLHADEAHVDAHLLAVQEIAGSRPVIRSQFDAARPPGGIR
jgi:hypothetical protein